MQKIIKRHLVLLAVITLISVPLSGARALADDQYQDNSVSAEKMILDLVVVRPLGIAATTVGTAFFIVSLPFTAIGGNTKEAGRKMVTEPSYFTFKRPLGHL